MNPCCRRAPRRLPFLLSRSRRPNSNPNLHPHTLFLMRNMRAICRPYSVISSFIGCCRSQARLGLVSPGRKPNFNPPRPASAPANPFLFDELSRVSPVFRGTTRRTLTRVAKWDSEKSPYETLELERDADDEKIKAAYRRLAKYYHPDVYDGRGTLEEGETAESRFIKIQAAYELLIDDETRQEYDRNHRVNPLKASQAWMEWLMKKRKAFDQRGDMAVAAWAEQQQRELNVRVRRLSRSKMDPDEERRILAKEKKASLESFNTTLKRHTLVLKKREIMRRKAEEDKKKFINQLLAAEGLELESDEDDEPAREQSKDA